MRHHSVYKRIVYVHWKNRKYEEFTSGICAWLVMWSRCLWMSVEVWLQVERAFAASAHFHRRLTPYEKQESTPFSSSSTSRRKNKCNDNHSLTVFHGKRNVNHRLYDYKVDFCDRMSDLPSLMFWKRSDSPSFCTLAIVSILSIECPLSGFMATANTRL